MALGPHVPEWKALQDELRSLAGACHARLVAVISTGNVLWCVSHFFPDVDALADGFYHDEIASRRKSLRRGAVLDFAVQRGRDACIARSFANIYVLVMWSRGTFDITHVRGEIRAALPKIEALTLNLPPPNPEPAEGAGKLHG